MSIDKFRTILALKEKGTAIKDIATTMGFSIVAIYKILDRYHNHCENGGTINNFLKCAGRKKNDVFEEDILIQEIIICDNSLTQGGIKKSFLRTTIYQFLCLESVEASNATK